MITNEDLRRLGAGRWVVPVLAELRRRNGARFVELLGIGIARDSLVRTLAQLTEIGWVTRNPGHGHPLRPEYILTPPGALIAETCQRLTATRDRLGLPPDALPRWSLPIIGHINGGWTRFTDLRASLTPVTPRALSLNLQQMIAGGLITRRLEYGFPPSSLYGLAQPGQDLLHCLTAERPARTPATFGCATEKPADLCCIK